MGPALIVMRALGADQPTTTGGAGNSNNNDKQLTSPPPERQGPARRLATIASRLIDSRPTPGAQLAAQLRAAGRLYIALASPV